MMRITNDLLKLRNMLAFRDSYSSFSILVALRQSGFPLLFFREIFFFLYRLLVLLIQSK